MYEIKSGRPIPPKRRPRNLRWPFIRMKVGDSIEVKTRRELEAALNAAKTTARRRLPQLKVSYRTRRGFYEVWRVA